MRCPTYIASLGIVCGEREAALSDVKVVAEECVLGITGIVAGNGMCRGQNLVAKGLCSCLSALSAMQVDT